MQSRGAKDKRTIQIRPLVGTTARILQKCDLRFSRIRLEQPTLIQIRAGVKEITDGRYCCRLVASDVVAIAGGQSLDITNHLDSHGTYEARWLVWDGSILAAFRAEQSAEPLATARKFPASPPLIEALDRAFDAVDGASRLPDSIARHRLVEMLVWLTEQGVCFETAREQTTERRVRDLLARRLGHDWTMTEVAESLAMSESSLRRHLAEAEPTLPRCWRTCVCRWRCGCCSQQICRSAISRRTWAMPRRRVSQSGFAPASALHPLPFGGISARVFVWSSLPNGGPDPRL